MTINQFLMVLFGGILIGYGLRGLLDWFVRRD